MSNSKQKAVSYLIGMLLSLISPFFFLDSVSFKGGDLVIQYREVNPIIGVTYLALVASALGLPLKDLSDSLANLLDAADSLNSNSVKNDKIDED